MANQDLKELLLVDESESSEGVEEFSSIEEFEKAQGVEEFSSLEEFEKAQGTVEGVEKLEGRGSRPKRLANPKNTVVLSAPTPHGEATGSLSRKLLIGALLTALIPLIIAISVLGLISQRSSEEAIVGATQQQLVSVRDAKKAQIEEAFDLFAAQIVNLAATAETIETMKHFAVGFGNFIFEANSGSPLSFEEIAQQKEAVAGYYNSEYLNEFQRINSETSIDTTPLLALNDTTFALQHQYIVDNPYPLGDKDDLEAAADGSSYSEVHYVHHNAFERFKETFGYYDIFLVEPENGHIIYSVEKEIDFATSLVDGPYANTPIGEAFRLAVASQEPVAYFADADFYPPSYNSNEMFVATPIFETTKKAQEFDVSVESGEFADGELVGVLIFQVPSERLDAIMTNNNEWINFGLGETGETYLVGPSRLAGFDYTLRSNSRFFVEDLPGYLNSITNVGVSEEVKNSIVAHSTVSGRQPIETSGVRSALAGEIGQGLFPDYRGLNVYSAFTPLDISGLNWALMAEMGQSEVLAPVNSLRSTFLRLSLGFLAIAAFIIIIATLQFVRGITNPVAKMVEVVRKVGQGDLSETVQINSNDEIGLLATSFNNSIVKLRDSLQTEQERDEERQRREQLQSNIGGFLDIMMDVASGDLTQRGKVSEDVLGNVIDATNVMLEEIGHVLREVQETAQGVGQSATEMIKTTETIAEDSKARVTRANQLAQAVQKVSDSINQMAKNADQSAQTAKQTLQASQQGGEAVENTLKGMQGIRREVQSISKRIKTLGDRSLEISEIADTINDLSRQTNLLSLNAAIEAAGAGEAGERFAVVANEVRKLASDSSESSQRVSQLIKNIQEEVQDVITTVEDGIREVEGGYRVANEAGERLKEIGQAAQGSAQVADLIANVTREQVQRISVINTNLKNMATAGTESLKIVNEGRESAEHLQNSSKVLIQNLERFRLEA